MTRSPTAGRRRWLRRTLAGLGLLVVAVGLWAVWSLILTRGRTPRIRSGGGEPVPGSVASLEEVELGGVPQTILIRGWDRRNPVLLFLHGGPGMPAMYLAHRFQREWERDFVVVHWDRKGAGKSYDALKPGDSLTVSSVLAETHALVDTLRRRFDGRRVLLVGHSWGSYLGMLAVREHSGDFLAFVGTGQLAASPDEAARVRREWIQDQARARGDTELLEDMDEGGPVTESHLFRYGAVYRKGRSFFSLVRIGLQAPEYDLVDALNVQRGSQIVQRRMRYDMDGGRPLNETTLAVDVPVYFFLGRHDYTTPSQLADRYLRALDAPRKRIVWFEESAHFPFLTQPDRFRQELLKVLDEVR